MAGTPRKASATRAKSADPAPRPHWTWWGHVLDLLLTVWVLRAAFGGLVIGALILWLAPQAQDLMVELATDTYSQQVIFFLLLLFVWAIPTHYASRLLLDTDERYLARLAARNTLFMCGLHVWMPRLFGAATFVIVAIGMARSWSNVPQVDDKFVHDIGVNLLIVGVELVIIAVLFVLYTMYRPEIAAFLGRTMRRGPRSAGRLSRENPRERDDGPGTVPAAVPDDGPPIDRRVGLLLLLMMTIGFVLGPLIFPLSFAAAFPRSAAVPFVVGAWVPVLCFLASKGRQHRFPWIATAFAILTITPAWLGNNYGVRRIDAAKQVKELVPEVSEQSLADIANRSLRLTEAVARWKEANGQACKQSSAACPRPLIIAAAGGASRAGFFTASVIGQLLDDGLKVDGAGHGLSATDVRNRLFAISSVSGSSVGAAMAVAALAAAKNDRQPCVPKSQILWFGSWRGLQIDNWRSCLEALMAGDFLTPVFDGFVFRDMLRVLHVILPGWSDRATQIERAWENHFAALIGKPESSPTGFRCSHSLICPFTTLRPLDGYWIPLLVINGTSVGTGQRIMTTPLEWQYERLASEKCPLDPRERSQACQLFLDADFFNDMVRSRNSNARPTANDIRISTAAHNSARFPVISPPGEIRSNDGFIVDRIVDGGYFENFGAYTAGEIARGISAVDPGLKPFVLVLSNDPQVPPIDPRAKSQKPQESQKPSQPAAGKEGNFLTDASGPIAAIMNARNAHGYVAVDILPSILDTEKVGGACSIVMFKVWGEPVSADDPDNLRELSMSWWLSKPVQMYLHDQTDFTSKTARGYRNLDAARAVLAAMRKSDGNAASTTQLAACPR